MVPTAFVTMSAFPLTPNGKVDRKAMPSPIAKVRESVAFAPPRGEIEEVIAQIWGRILGAERIGAHDNFFDLGGHSLLATRFIAAVNKTFGVKLGISAVFRFPTVSLLGAEVNRIAGSHGEMSHMAQLQKGGHGASIYFIRAGTLEQRIAGLVGEGYNIFGVDILLPIGEGVPSAKQGSAATPTLKDLAASYADAILAHAGAEPMVVAGYSFSGKVAFETASLLLKRGACVSFVLLVDTYAWGGLTVGTARRSLKAIHQAYSQDPALSGISFRGCSALLGRSGSCRPGF